MKTAVKTFLSVFFLLFIVSCSNSTKNMQMLISGNDSLTKKITQMEDTLRQTEMNKRMVADFYQQLFGDKDISSIDKYIGDVYIQHNPSLPDGKEALKKGAAEWFKGAPKEKINIQHLGADGNFVYIHTKSTRGTKTISVIDIFRIQNGKIMEHWDVIQDVPDKTANPHPMF